MNEPAKSSQRQRSGFKSLINIFIEYTQKHPFLRTVFIVISLLLFLCLINDFYEKQIEKRQILIATQDQNANKTVLGLEVRKESQGFPIRLIIPAINVNASIQLVGITSKGEMDVPSNIIDVGWLKLGTRPGEKGSAVIDGHVNGSGGETGVFANLEKLKEGDRLYIEDDKGVYITFVVREIHTYDSGYADEVFNQNDGAHLNLITCNGVWNEAKKSYSKRLVVFSDISQ